MKHLHTSLILATATLLSACATHAPQATPSPAPLAKSTQNPLPTDKAVVALVLGGGGTRGYAHIGAIKALQEHGIKPDMVVGTSVGAMVGAVYASGKSAQELERLAQELEPVSLLDVAPSKQGLIEGVALRDYINHQVNHQPIERLPMRFSAVATELHSKATVTIRHGDTGLAVQASSSVPKLFIPPYVGNKKYIDGGQNALLPSAIAKSMGADIVIAVDLMAHTPKTQSSPEQTTPSPIAGIKKTDAGIEATWGKDSVIIPINLDKINEQTKDLPISINFDKLFGMIPANTQIAIPQGLPTKIPTSKDEAISFANQILGTDTFKASQKDILASDVLIRPDLSEHAVFSTQDSQAMIDKGYQATLAQIPAIKQAIAKHAKNQHNQKHH